jgi:hypothetical protein
MGMMMASVLWAAVLGHTWAMTFKGKALMGDGGSLSSFHTWNRRDVSQKSNVLMLIQTRVHGCHTGLLLLAQLSNGIFHSSRPDGAMAGCEDTIVVMVGEEQRNWLGG